MSFATTALRYGWVYLTALGVITGTTIYVVNNTRQQVKPEDIIEIMLGTYERCLATQTSTNPTYAVSPINLIQSWVKINAMVLNGTAYKVCYTSYWPSTTGVGVVQRYTSSVQPSINYAASWTETNGWVWTNVSTWPSITVTDSYEIVTNTIGWFPDRDYMIVLDAKIKALVPYYVDTNTVYDGTTNIAMLTVTGLWASLEIGDRTNKFTRTPAWTNPTTYGDYPWQIYVEDLQERYKVLNALKIPKPNYSETSIYTNITKYGNSGRVASHWFPQNTYDLQCQDGGGTVAVVLKIRAKNAYDGASIVTNNAVNPIAASKYAGYGAGGSPDDGHWCSRCTDNTGYTNWTEAKAGMGGLLWQAFGSGTYLSRGARRLTYSISLANFGYVHGFNLSFQVEVITAIPVSYGVYVSQGDFPIEGTNFIDGGILNSANTNITVEIGNYALSRPTWAGTWGGGYGVSAIDTKIVYTYNAAVNTNFNYCTNKYW